MATPTSVASADRRIRTIPSPDERRTAAPPNLGGITAPRSRRKPRIRARLSLGSDDRRGYLRSPASGLGVRSEDGRRVTEVAPAESGPPTHQVGLSSTGVFLISVLIQVIGVAASVVLNRFVGITDSGPMILGTVQLYLLIASSI